jgi:hypothetical protein
MSRDLRQVALVSYPPLNDVMGAEIFVMDPTPPSDEELGAGD